MVLISSEVSRLDSLKRLPQIKPGVVELVDQQVALKVVAIDNDAPCAGRTGHLRSPSLVSPHDIDGQACQEQSGFFNKSL
jgi:hypothetical protein